jgi:hypothetical protein
MFSPERHSLCPQGFHKREQCHANRRNHKDYPHNGHRLIQPAAQTAVQDSQTTQAEDEESAFFLLFMGGGLLIILFAVISAMSTVSGAISIAVNMDVDGE